MAVSDQESAFELIQHAFTVAETFQIPVVVLTEKEIAENVATVPSFTTDHIPLQRNLVTDPDELKKLVSRDRYALTDSGISKRRIPGSGETYFFCNGDEHHEDGTLDESPATAQMIEKRIKKSALLETSLSEPILYGDADPEHVYIGRGSTKMVMHDVLNIAKEQGKNIAYVHVERLRPLKKAYFRDLLSKHPSYTIIENNATGQLATLLQQELGMPVSNRLNKRDGRQRTVEEVWEHIEQLGI